ncbi:MAG: AgmX/PglI C-terminal domain-containing protein [Fibrobacteres bacterium]|nr:AgmX/PglI C-terminal domain-containing protein [Fibrobacterota bacterium]
MDNLTFTSMGMSVKRGEFPAEFKQGFAQSLDKRFLKVFAVCFAILMPLFLIGALQEPPKEVSLEEMERMQERYARLVLNQPIEKKEKKVEEVKKEEVQTVKKEEEEEAKKEEERAQETVEEKKVRKEATTEQRAQKREAMKKQLDNVGLFAELTAGTGGGRGSSRAVQDLIGNMDATASISNVSLSGESFAAKKSESVGGSLGGRRGERTEGGTISTSNVEAASAGTLKSEGQVAMSKLENVVGDAAGDASRDIKTLNRVLQKYQPRLKKVYEDFLKKNPDLAGKIIFKITIEADGSVSSVVVVSSELKDSELERNLIRYVERIKFDGGASGKLTIEWPIVFSAS